MFSLFKKKDDPSTTLKFADIDGHPLKEGDLVLSLRYELGRCRIVNTGEGFEYQSLENGKRISWTKMIDATTKNQKVRKLE